MSQDNRQPESIRQWLTGIVVIVAVIVSFVGFARVSVEWTLTIASVVLVLLVLLLWRVGRKKRAGRSRG